MVNDFINSRIGSKPFITITARELDRGDKNGTRSINRSAWNEVFEDIDSIGVIPILVRDTEKAFDKPMFENVIEAEVASIHLPFRLALYERALLNFTKNNGPSTLLLYSTCKSIFYNKFDESFKPVSAEWFARNYGMVFAANFP